MFYVPYCTVGGMFYLYSCIYTFPFVERSRIRCVCVCVGGHHEILLVACSITLLFVCVHVRMLFMPCLCVSVHNFSVVSCWAGVR